MLLILRPSMTQRLFTDKDDIGKYNTSLFVRSTNTFGCSLSLLNMFALLVTLACGLAPATAATPSPNSCLLPAFPANGTYTSSGVTGVPRPGDEVSRLSALEYSCSPGYFLTEDVSVCRGNNIWSSKPACKKRCTLYGSDTVEYSCFSEQVQRIPCEPAMPHGSYVHFECKTGHTLSGTQTLEEVVCLDGSWSRETPDCEAVCGLENAEVSVFITKAEVAPKDSLPWHVAVYRGTEPTFTYICGGTIIRSRLVIGAAHCFYDSVNRQALSAQYYRVAASKHYQAWNHQDEPNAPYSEVREIRLHNYYTGDLHHEQNDLALLILETPFEFSNKVGAICLNLANQGFDRLQLSAGSEGKFAGWGVTEEGVTAEELRVLRVPVIGRRACRDEYQKYHSERYITADKICAGFLNGSAGCNGDSGAGLVFPSIVFGQKTWWLRGVLSIGPRETDSDRCRSNTYTAYTRIFALGDWLKQQINDLSSQRELFQVTCSLPKSNTVNFACYESDNSPTPCKTKIVDGKSINPSCKEGYVGRGRLAVMTCHQGRWDNPIPKCIPIPKTISPGAVLDGLKCALPSYPANGKFRLVGPNKTLLPGTIVNEYTTIIYYCDTSYEPSTTNVDATCEGGNWSNPPPVCRIADRTCPPLPKDAVTAQKTGQKAWDKCIELAESVYPCDKSTGLRRYSCAHVATPLILGGVQATPGEFPHMAHVGSNTGLNDSIEWQCGGTLVSERWVVTAANCATYYLRVDKGGHVRLGGNDVSREKPEDIYKIIKTVVHPAFTAGQLYNNIALVQLDRDVQFTELVRPACLHTGGPVADDRATVTGWGITSTRGSPSDQLLKVSLEKFSFDECSELTPMNRRLRNGIDNASQICFGHHTEEKDTCQGDSGGPLQIYNGKEVDCTYLVIGMSSFGKSCGIAGYPSVYTRLSAYIPWIESIVWPESDNIVFIMSTR